MMLIEWFDKLPSEALVFVGATLGGVITLFATFLQGLFGHYRFKEQLIHDKNMRHTEREMSMRREIYYDSLESICTIINMIANVADLNIVNLSNYQSKQSFSVYQRVQLIAGDNVLLAFNNCSELIADALLSLTMKKVHLNGLEINRDSADEMRKIASNAMDKIVQEMAEYNKKGINNPSQWALLTNLSDEYNNDVNTHIENSYDLSKRIAIEKINIIKESVGWIKEINPLAGQVVISMKRELQPDTPEKSFLLLEKSLTQLNDRSVKSIEKFIQDIDALMKEEFATEDE